MMFRKLFFALALIGLLLGGFAQAQVTRGIPVIDVTAFGAKPNDGVDDTADIAEAIAAAAAYEAVHDTIVYVQFPRGTFEVQDTDTDFHPLATDGGIIIPSTTENIVLRGNDTTLKIGSNGISTSVIRCFADNCVIEGFTVDPNCDAAPVARDTSRDYATGTLTANGSTTIAGSGTTWTKEMVGRTISISGTIYTITGFTSTTSLQLSGSPSGGAGLSYNIWPFATKDNSGFELNGCENSAIRDCFVLNGDKTISTYNTGTITYTHSTRTVTLTGGSWPGWVGTDAAITIAGTRYAVASAPTTTTLTLNADGSTDINNPGSDVSSTSNWSATAYSTASGGENHFLIINGRRCRIERCLSLDCIYAPFFVSGTTDTETVHGTALTPILDNANYVTDCTAVNFRGNGLRINSGRSIFVRGFNCYSLRNDGRSGILCDAGSDEGDLRTERVFIEDCELYCNPDGDFDGAASILKIASVYQAHVTNCKVEAGSETNSVSVRLEDNVRSAYFQDCYIRPNIYFTPASGTGSIFQGDLTAAANSGGFVQYTVSGTPASAIVDRELNVRGSAVQQYNGPQKVTARAAGTITTDRPYVSTGIGSVAHGQTGVGQLVMRNCVVDGIQEASAGVSGVSHYNYMIQNCNAYEVDIQNCTFNQKDPLDVQYGCINTDYSTENGWTMFRFVGNKVTFDTDKTCRVHRGTTASTEVSTSGKVIWYDNYKSNKDSGTTLWCDETNSEREILFNSEGENPRAWRWNAAPASAHVTWAVGDIIWNTAPSGTDPLGWVCVTAGSPGTWTPLGLDYTLQSTVVDVGNVGTGEDNLISYTLPANTLNTEGEGLEIEAGFSFAANGNTKQVKMYFGAAAFYASGASAHNDGGLVVRAIVTRDTSSIAKVGYMVTATGGGTPFALAAGDAANASADMTAAVTIKGTGEATSNNDVVMEYLRVRKVPAP